MTSSGGVGATYNGDGVLVQRGATRYTQDLAAGLSQVLHDGTANAVYGHERLVTQQGATCTWYATDALGSVRMTLDGAGAVQGTVGYDPWGTPQGDLLGTFGFTGELQDGASGLVHVRTRWYEPGQSTFTSRDPFAGFPATPYSLHPYQYAYSNPALWTDPTGECVGWIWGDPTCQFIGWDRIRRGDLNYADATPWAGAGVDFTPGIGDLKGLIEVYTGCDIVTGEALGWWRWTGLIFLSELRQLRRLGYLDDFTDIGKFGEDVSLPPRGGTRYNDPEVGPRGAGDGYPPRSTLVSAGSTALQQAMQVGRRTIQSVTPWSKIESQLRSKDYLLGIPKAANVSSASAPAAQQGLARLNNISRNPERVWQGTWRSQPVYEYIQGNISVVRDRGTGELVTVLQRNDLSKLEEFVRNGTAQWLK